MALSEEEEERLMAAHRRVALLVFLRLHLLPVSTLSLKLFRLLIRRKFLQLRRKTLLIDQKTSSTRTLGTVPETVSSASTSVHETTLGCDRCFTTAPAVVLPAATCSLTCLADLGLATNEIMDNGRGDDDKDHLCLGDKWAGYIFGSKSRELGHYLDGLYPSPPDNFYSLPGPTASIRPSTQVDNLPSFHGLTGFIGPSTQPDTEDPIHLP
ncbi:hypothetical protein RJ639_023529 [Escallonia herrerae]|uniref:Uncharacterized protein n=1 Tax=Escallonia herrerae TaxID=1293975 RepID=A0AA89AFE4_9ASTE|nr:hypothetical protein RJ639_023529 [Escallonia herrerae]